MEYDPIKNKLGVFFNMSAGLRKLFYKLLDLLLLRTWHIHKQIKIWEKTAPAKVNILDAGMGFGQYSFWMASRHKNWNILGVDVKDEQVADCNNFFTKTGRTNAKFEVADLTKFSKPDSFDFALSVDVMEHILEDVEVFKNICAALHKGGMLLISTPSDQGGSDAEESGESFIGEHVRNGYNIKEIEEKLFKGGFSKVEAKYSYGTSGHISWVLSMKWPMKILAVTKAFIILLPFYYLITFPFCLILNAMDRDGTHATGTGLIVKAWK